MKIGSRGFVRTVNGKAFNAIFISYARRILPDMREFFQTEEGKAYLADWLKKNRNLQREMESQFPLPVDPDEDDDDDY